MDSLTSGTLLARRYRLLDRIGVGGMSVIWRAHDEMLDRLVAIKALASALAVDARHRAWVRTEARAAAALDHPCVTAVYDYGETLDGDGGVIPFVVMELLGGESLSARLTEGPLPWREAVEICVEVAGALAAAHRRGVVHRDITPDNIMLSDTGVKVLDFGIATTIGAPDEDEDGATFGTPAYVAPERLDGRKARPETDTYALGVVLHEMLTGHPPFPVETWEELAALRQRQPPPLSTVSGLPGLVAELCHRCLSADPRQRPTAAQVARQLRRQLPGPIRLGRRRMLTVGAAAVALTLGVLIGATVINPAGSPVASPTAGALGGQSPTPGSDPAVTPGPGPSPMGEPVPGARAPLTQARVRQLPIDTTGLTVDAAFAALHQIIDDGLVAREIRVDVARDLRQLLDNLERDLARGTADLAAASGSLRDKIYARAGEGALSWDLARTLDAALTDLASV